MDYDLQWIFALLDRCKTDWPKVAHVIASIVWLLWPCTQEQSDNIEGDTPPFGTQYLGFLDGTQYAKGRYAVRKNPNRTQTSLFNFKSHFFIKKHNKIDIQSKKTRIF